MYPNAYHKERECIYEIIAPLGKAISLDWLDFDLEGNTYPDCTYDYVEVYDGVPDDTSSLGRYCSQVVPPQAISKMNLMTLKFGTDSSIEGRGWKANYTFIDTGKGGLLQFISKLLIALLLLGCGGVIKTANQTIRPPQEIVVGGNNFEHSAHENFMRQFRTGFTSPNSNCTWVIVAPPKYSINLYWNSFDIEEAERCQFDSVTVTEGTTSRSYCGTTIPPIMTTVGNVVKVNFVSDSTVSSGGFELTYSFNNPEQTCGGTFVAAGGFLQSPNYPHNYPPFKECTWIIQAPPGHQIHLKSNAFTMESHDHCNFDFLEVRNGATNTSTLLGKFCGTNFPSNLKSFSNVLFIRFVSDFSHSESGFEIEWESTATGCGGILTTHEGSISSPNYPMPYHNGAYCTYRIDTSQGSNLEIVFDDLDFEARSYCFDSVEVLDGKTMKSLTKGPICSRATPFNFTTTDNTAIVLFKTDYSDSGRGFNLNYKTLCNRKLKGLSGVIESPNFPNNYPHHLDCDWTIEVPLGNKIGIEFSHFDLEIPVFAEHCDFDYLEIAELDETDRAIETKRHCRAKPKAFESSAKSVKIKLHSDVSQTQSGFRLEWRILGCGGVLDRPGGRIQENNFNRSMTPTECNWKIVTSPGRHVELNISEFHYDGAGDCGNGDNGGLIVREESFWRFELS